jgi:Cu+-exporting ATPase
MTFQNITLERVKVMAKETLKITGMTCAACAARIEKVVGKMDGVGEVSVNLATEKAMVAFDPQKTALQSIKERIEKAGYGAVEMKEKKLVDEDKLRKEKENRIGEPP